MFSLNEILLALCNKQLTTDNRFFSEVAIDSRLPISGTLFVALSGERTDGHRYVTEAFRKGALAALVNREIPGVRSVDLRECAAGRPLPEQFPDFPFCLIVDDTLLALQRIAAVHRDQLNLKVVGITGTVGKSTTKELVYEVVSQSFITLRNSGNLNNEIGLPMTLLQAGKGHRVAILEMGFYVAGEIKLLCDIAKPEIGVITNIGTVHAERAGTIDDIANGKAELVEELPEDGIAILNYDDPYVLPMAAKTKARVMTYGLDPRADIRASEIESYGLEGIRFKLTAGSEEFRIRIPLIGRHSVHTALRAIAVGRALDMSWQNIILGLSNGQSHLRMTVMYTENGAMIIDDTYNASPDSVLAALSLLQEIGGYKVAILGEMRELGQYETQGHRSIGQRVAHVCDEFIAVGEKMKEAVFAAINGGLDPKRIKWFGTVAETINYTKLRNFSKGETILIKGSRGLQMEQIVDSMETK